MTQGPGPRDDERERGQLRAVERHGLVTELHESVTNHLSVATLQLMSYADSSDVGELREILHNVARSVGAALEELRLLTRLQFEEFSAQGARPSGEPVDLTVRSHPAVVAESVAQRLEGAGLVPRSVVPDEVDGLPLSLRETLVRGLEVVADVATAHAQPGTEVDVLVEVGPAEVVVSARLQLRPGSDPTAAEAGLDALRHRVDLIGGTLRAQASDADQGVEWLMGVRAPRVR